MPYLSENKFSPAEAGLLTALPRLSNLQTGGRRAFVFLEKDSVVLKERVAVDAGVLQQFF